MKNSNKILIISNGKENILEFHKDLISQLIEEKYYINIFNPSINKEDLKSSFTNLEIQKIEVISRVPEYLPKNIFFIIFRLFLSIYRDNYKYIISFMINSILISGIFSMVFKKIEFIGSIEGVGSIFEKGNNKLSTNIKILLLKSYFHLNIIGLKKIIFINNDNKEFFNKNFPIIKNKKQLLLKYGNGIRVFKHKIRNLETKNQVNFIMVSRILEEKGIVEFIKASKEVSKKIKNISFTHVGGDPLPPRKLSSNLSKLIRDSNHIKFLGKRDDVYDIILEFDVLILPSYNEGFSASIMEALVSGLYVITTDVPGCRQSIEHDFEGVLVKHKDIFSLQKSIEDSYYNIEEIRSNAKKIREGALKKFDSIKSQKNIKDFILS